MEASPFRGVVASLATMHGKQWALRPLLRRRLGLSLRLADVDTDVLGTFTGEVRRAGSARETVVRKARLGMAATGSPVGLASEGAFGPHPVAPWTAADVEYVALLDDRTGLTVVEHVVSVETNHGHVVTDGRDLAAVLAFLRGVGFPHHAVVVRPAAGTAQPVKGIGRLTDVLAAVRRACAESADGAAVLCADLRAHVNPTRMRVIAAAGERLARRLATPCPACAAPGFGPVGAEPGLPCRDCGTPTPRDALLIFGCDRCPYRSRRPLADAADPGSCPVCNP
ncbi:DUF6671 family protein [Micromonospora endolithica]|uniref:DUF6671 domain-containing protein n=1 Tax=Micromonospora endolithica TaxID=230091 RepID=A0A3A9Z0X0_9ACTN|nr:DUF6671 family protein [Micromonospora endolithica]RKN41046.1 hypothetical protein D7223_25205 [Micromonospora endolithica]TWJ24267.1 hypothetical protein JD76_04416 [Micromonospora endolithica]